MSASRPENVVETKSNTKSIEKVTPKSTMGSEKVDIDSDGSEFVMADSGSVDTSKSHLRASSELKTPSTVKKTIPIKNRPVKSTVSKPLPVKTISNNQPPPKRNITNIPIKNPLQKAIKPSTLSLKSNPLLPNKHTLEVQFLNKKKRLGLLTKEMMERQKPILDLYENLVGIKEKLKELGRTVFLEEIKLVSLDNVTEKEPLETNETGAGEAQVPKEIVLDMKTSIEEIPKTLLSICQNLLGRRAVIVELLESVTKSEITVEDISDKIEALKSEGTELQKSLDVIIGDHEHKIQELISSWQELLSEKQVITNNHKIEDLQEQVNKQQKLIMESNEIIQDLQKKLDEKKIGHDKSVNELDMVIRGLRDQIRKLEADIDTERKATIDHKTRNNVNNQTIKMLKTKIAELENKTKEFEDKNSELSKKLKHAQDTHKNKENQWNKDKDDLKKTLKQQEAQLQKISNDRTQFETRCKNVEYKKGQTEMKLLEDIEGLRRELEDTKEALTKAKDEKEVVTERCSAVEEYIVKLGLDSKKDIHNITAQVDWGKHLPQFQQGIEDYCDEVANKVLVEQLQDKIRQLEKENLELHTPINTAGSKAANAVETVKHTELIAKYQQLLEESEEKLKEKYERLKSMEVEKLTSEIRHLKVRQDVLEQQSVECPIEELQLLAEEGRAKLNELMKKSFENEQKITDYECIIEKQTKQINEMENLLRYRDNMTGVLQTSRDELIFEKECLTKYSQELRTVLIEVTKDTKHKDRLIKETQEKLELRERQIAKLEKDIRELEGNLAVTNEKRFRLQEAIGTMEKELQSTKAQVSQLADIQTRYEIGMKRQKVYLQNKTDISIVSLDEELLTENANPMSLLNVSLKKVDFLRKRLHHLSNIDQNKQCYSLSNSNSSQSFVNEKSVRNFRKIIELAAKRCELLQHKVDQSYDELIEMIPKRIKSASDLNKNQFSQYDLVDDSIFSVQENFQAACNNLRLHAFLSKLNQSNVSVLTTTEARPEDFANLVEL